MRHSTDRDNFPHKVKGKLSPYVEGDISPNVRRMKTFREALIDALDATDKSLRSVATEADVSYEQLKKLKQNPVGTTNVDDAVRVAAAFGMTLDQFLQSPDGTAPHAVTEKYIRLTDEQQKAVAKYLEFVAAGSLDQSP
jgi:hypothetical protein